MITTLPGPTSQSIATPAVDWHALAPAIVIVATILAILLADLVSSRRDSGRSSTIAALGLLGALVPVATLAHAGGDRVCFGGAFVVDDYSLALQAFFIVATYVTVLLSVDDGGDDGAYRSEYHMLLLTSAFGMVIMASARDLISLFVALETISIPTFVLAAFRKHDRKSNEAGVKYYVIGVLSSAVMLYGMSLIFGVTGTTLLSGISEKIGSLADEPIVVVGIFLALVGFAFKVSAVPFHWWAPDTYEGAPTPVTAFLSVASKAGGFVALITIVYFGFFGEDGSAAHAWWPWIWVLAAASMTDRKSTRLNSSH